MISRTLFLATIALLVAVPATAQVSTGVRAGVSGDPDQFVFGGHVETGPLLERLTFRPNVEIGVGDRVTTAGINIEFAYSIPLEDHPWRVYLGAGPAVNFHAHDDDRPGRGNDSNVGGGFNLLVGAQHDGGLFTELKVGAIDSPRVKFLVGYAFR